MTTKELEIIFTALDIFEQKNDHESMRKIINVALSKEKKKDDEDRA